MTFLTILGVTEILCSFRLAIKGKTGRVTGRVIKIRVQFSANNFAYQMQKTTPPPNR